MAPIALSYFRSQDVSILAKFLDVISKKSWSSQRHLWAICFFLDSFRGIYITRPSILWKDGPKERQQKIMIFFKKMTLISKRMESRDWILGLGLSDGIIPNGDSPCSWFQVDFLGLECIRSVKITMFGRMRSKLYRAKVLRNSWDYKVERF